MRNVISNRQTELALTTGRLFTTDEALKIGLIDEVATDKADAVAKAEKFLVGMSKISGNYTCAYGVLEWTPGTVFNEDQTDSVLP
jgi:enoyl-CoA hydratase/carnithine racemase